MCARDFVVQALEKAEIDYDKDNWDPERSFAGNGIDSLDFKRLLMSISELCGVEVTDEEAAELPTPKRRSGAFEKVRQDLTVMDLAAGDDKAPGTTVFIDYGVNLACAAAA